MSEVTEKIKKELLDRCEKYKEKYGYDYWNEHIKYVVQNAVKLAKEYGADVEITELGALLHDIAKPSEYGPSEEHDIYGAEIAEELLKELNYPSEKIKHVKNCVLNHRGSVERPRNTIEEQCVADADVIAHFDCLPLLFSVAYGKKDLSVSEGEEWIKGKLARDYKKLSPRTKEVLKDRYENILNVLFVN